MKKLIVFVIIAVCVGAIWVLLLSPQAKIRNLRAEIMQANYCEVTSDCQLVAESYCPIGCYIYVNTNEAPRITALLKESPSNCQYSCAKITGIECRQNQCQTVE